MASNKTPNLNLDIWAEMDFFKRSEMNNNFSKIDEKISEMVVDVQSSGIETNDLPDYRGVNYFGDNVVAAFVGDRITSVMNSIVTANMNMVILNATNYMPTYTSNTFNGQTQSNADITSFCNKAKAKGLMIGFKPLVQSADGTWRANIAPSNVATWFANYKTWIMDQVNLAQSIGAETFCIGTELRSMTGWENRAYWEDLITSIRAVFTGNLTYAANGHVSSDRDEMYTVCFIDLLDFAGIDFYPQLTNKNDPTVEELIAAWHKSADGTDWIGELEKWQVSHGKPIILTEVGCASKDGANKATGTTFHGEDDPQEQADFIQSMFAVFNKRCSWLKGLWWWDISSKTDDAYSFEKEPALSAMREGFTSKYKGGKING